MKRRIRILILTALVCLIFSGCTSVVTLNHQENAQISQYIVGRLLSYDKNYEDRLIIESFITPSEEPEASIVPQASIQPQSSIQPEASVEPQVSTQPEVASATMEDIYPSKDYTVSYVSYQCCQEYPKGDPDFLIEAEEGGTLAVVEFNVKNVTTAKKKVDLTREGITYKLVVPDAQQTNQEIYADMAILKNGGLRFLDTTLAAGKSENAVLIFNIPKGCDMSKGVIQLIRDEKTCSLSVE